jgi:4'-phosphopantetheinyl transferase
MKTDLRSPPAGGHAAQRAALAAGMAHVWRVPLTGAGRATDFRRVLSADERARADGFHDMRNGTRFTLAHGWLRQILARYLDRAPEAIHFETGQFGKPYVSGRHNDKNIAFNLSHSGELALVAVTAGVAVGVDVQQWDPSINHAELAEQVFSPRERAQLHSLSADGMALAAGFYAGWTRKEAYIKAQGYGMARGLRHFDVSLAPMEPARLLADRSGGGAGASARWAMAAINAAPGYSAAVACEGLLHHVHVLDV